MLKFWHRSSTIFYHFICGINSLNFNLYTKPSILYTLNSILNSMLSYGIVRGR